MKQRGLTYSKEKKRKGINRSLRRAKGVSSDEETNKCGWGKDGGVTRKYKKVWEKKRKHNSTS